MASKDPVVVSSTLPTLHLDLLRAGDGAESKNLLDACRLHGFFYLDLTSDLALCQQWKDMLAVMKRYFEQPLEVKIKDARGSDNYGYEGIGTEVGPKPKTRDGYESLKISRREFLASNTDLTTRIRHHSHLFFSFMQTAHNTTILLLKLLSDQLGLKGAARFEAYHAEPGPSHSTLGMLRYPKQTQSTLSSVGHNKHTDVGSLTFLLAGQWGLQILSPFTQRWEFLEPRPGHAIVNVGDSLRFPSGGELASVVHRVIPVKEVQEEDRYSIAYFLRVNDDAKFQDGMGREWSAKEWHDFKFGVFKSESVDPDGKILTGMMEENDRLVAVRA